MPVLRYRLAKSSYTRALSPSHSAATGPNEMHDFFARYSAIRFDFFISGDWREFIMVPFVRKAVDFLSK